MGGILGAAVLGPFGAIWGASLGSGFGASRKEKEAEIERLQSQGLTPDMVKAAETAAQRVVDVKSGLDAAEESWNSYKEFAKKLEKTVATAEDKAKACLVAGDEDGARDSLAYRQRQKQKLLSALVGARDGRERVNKMEENLEAAEIEVRRVEALMAQAVSLKFSEDSGTSYAPQVEDPLLERFKRLEEEDGGK